MKKIRAKIINLECNNIFSLSEACKKAGYNTSIIDSYKKEEYENTDILFLPGVGAFNEAMKVVRKKNLDELILKHVSKKKTLVGICLGMQLLFSSSVEFKLSKGLELIKGEVKKIKKEKNTHFPHIGWRKINTKKGYTFWQTINKKFFYFIHSYYCNPENKNLVTSTVNYGGQKICSSVQSSNIIGTQFNPEKSGLVGIKFLKKLKNFV